MRHFISLDNVSAAEFADLLTLAAYLKRRRAQGLRDHVAGGRTLAMVFEKPSLRTRLSFELAWTELGGHAIYIKGEEVGLDVREPTPDVARVLGRYVHAIMARVYKHRTVELLAEHGGVPVVNGLSDLGHPCQALGDFQTIAERFRRINGLKVVFVGDANNVSRSLARACILAGSEFVLARPDGYAFTAEDRTAFGSAYGSQVREERDPAKAAEGAHVLYTDVWTSMGQEAEKAARLAAFQGYQIGAPLIAGARPDAIVMHCLPAHRGEEVTHDAMEHARSAVWDQAENRLHAQQAVLRMIACPGADRGPRRRACGGSRDIMNDACPQPAGSVVPLSSSRSNLHHASLRKIPPCAQSASNVATSNIPPAPAWSRSARRACSAPARSSAKCRRTAATPAAAGSRRNIPCCPARPARGNAATA